MDMTAAKPPRQFTERGKFDSPVGLFQIGLIDEGLAWISLPARQPCVEITEASDSVLMVRVKVWLNCYFSEKVTHCDLPLVIAGTPFQRRVWQALLEIPYGTTLSYAQLAQQLNTHPRAIGNACRHNQIPLIIPCHRIVAKNGLGGFAGEISGDWPKLKQWLITYEQQQTLPTTS